MLFRIYTFACKVNGEHLDLICKVLEPRVVSAFIEEIPEIAKRPEVREIFKRLMHDSVTYESCDAVSKRTLQVMNDPWAFLTLTSAVGSKYLIF